MGVTVAPSTRQGKKIDVFDDGRKVASIGAVGYGDYGTYLEERGKPYADERRWLYRLRHRGEGIGERYARELLW